MPWTPDQLKTRVRELMLSEGNARRYIGTYDNWGKCPDCGTQVRDLYESTVLAHVCEDTQPARLEADRTDELKSYSDDEGGR